MQKVAFSLRFIGTRLGCEAGNVLTIFALVFPLIALLGIGAVQISMLYTDQARTQDVADATALMLAQQISQTTSGVSGRGQAYALGQLSDMQQRATVSVNVTEPTQTSVTVEIGTHRASFFGNLLPMGGFDTHATATAKPLGLMPLCVLVFGDANCHGANIHLQDQSILQAPACLVHSNQDVQVDASAQMNAAITEASGAAKGPITPAADSGAPTIADPFGQIDITFPAGCSSAAPGSPPGAATTLVIDGDVVGDNSISACAWAVLPEHRHKERRAMSSSRRVSTTSPAIWSWKTPRASLATTSPYSSPATPASTSWAVPASASAAERPENMPASSS